MKRILASLLVIGVLASPSTARVQAAEMDAIVGLMRSILSGLQERIAALGGGALTAQVSSSVPTSGLIGHWAFDEGGGTTAADGSGNGKDGMLSGGPAWTSGRFGGALDFDGSDDIVDIVDVAAGSNSTLSIWIKPGGVNSGRYLFKGDSSGYQRIGVFGSSGNIGFYTGGGYVYGSVNLNDGSFHHVAFVDSGSPRTRTVYVDGQVDIAATALSGSAYANSNTLRAIGGGYGYFKGIIDEVRLYNRALDSQEIAALAGGAASPSPAPAPAPSPAPAPTSGSSITVNPSVTYQTMDAWEATAYAGQDNASFSQFKNALLDSAVNDLGINRVRLEVRTGAENTVDHWTQYQNGQITKALFNCNRYAAVNDNGSPATINSSGFQFSELDNIVRSVVNPMRSLAAARGERLQVNLNVVDFNKGIVATGCPAGLQSFHHSSPQEYAELVLAAYKHLQSVHGFVPDYVEVVLEPDNTTWTAAEIGNAIVATADLLSQNGFSAKFIAPSTTSGPSSRAWFDGIAAVAGALQHLDTISYHRYVNADASITGQIASRGSQNGKKTAMLELIGATADTLHLDLKTGNNSAWQQYTIGGGPNDSGGGYFVVNSSNAVSLGSRTKFLRQYFKFVRNGATRIGATSDDVAFDPVAFRNANGAAYGDVVVVKATAGGTFGVRGLAAGTYGIKYTTGDRLANVTQYDVDAQDQTISTGGIVTATIPASGVITIYGKKSTPPPISLPSPGTSPAPSPSPLPAPAPAPVPTPVPQPSSAFSAGDRVQTTSNLNVRGSASASGALLGTQSSGALGTIAGGGASADGYYWWNVNYDSGADGWSVENYLSKYSTPAPAPAPVPAPVPVPVPSGGGNAWFVAPNGTSDAINGGTSANPWNLHAALAHPSKVKPGDTVYLRGGTYKPDTAAGKMSFDSKLSGTASSPITVRSYPGEWATLDGNLSAFSTKNHPVLIHSAGGHTVYRDFEITNSDPTSRLITQDYSDNSNPPVRRGNGFIVQAKGVKAINIILHDTGSGLTAYQAAPDFEAHGMVIYNNGWDAPGRLHGHGIYTHGDNGYKLFSDNITGDNFGLSFRVGGSTGSVVIDNYKLTRNVMTGGQVIIGTTPVTDLAFENNYLYGTPADFGFTGSNNVSQDMKVTGNHLIGGYYANPFSGHLDLENNVVRGPAVLFVDSGWTPGLAAYDLANNTYYKSHTNYPYWQFKVTDVPNSSNPYAVGYYGFNCQQGSQVTTCNYLKNQYESWQGDLLLDTTSTFVDAAPTGVKAFVNPIYGDSGLANVVVYNFDKLNSVQVDVSNLGWSTGALYELRNTLDYFGDIVRGTYDGSGRITVPMTGHTVAKPVGYDQTSGWFHYSLPTNYFPEFGVFRLIRTSGTGASSPAPSPAPSVPGPILSTPVISSFTASPSSVVSGNSSILSWAVSNATSLSIDNGVGAVSGLSKTISPAQTATYTLTATNAAGSSNATAAVAVTQPASHSILATAAGGGTITPSGTVTVRNGDSQTFSIVPLAGHRIKDVAVNGTSVGAVSSHMFSNVTANHSISAAFEALSPVNPAPNPTVSAPIIKSFLADPSSIPKGGTAKLSWSVSDASIVTINGQRVTGASMTVNPDRTTSYTLGAANDGGTVSSQSVVTVTDPPRSSGGGASSGGTTRTRTVVTTNARTAPSLSSPVSGSLIADTIGTVREVQGTWANIEFDNGVVGWTPISTINTAAGNSGAPLLKLSRELDPGARGDDVAMVQSFLISRGHLAPGNASGYFGPLTATAVKKFQEAEGIARPGGPGYGRIGPVTKARMEALASVAPAALNAAEAERQALIQRITEQLAALMQELFRRLAAGQL